MTPGSYIAPTTDIGGVIGTGLGLEGTGSLLCDGRSLTRGEPTELGLEGTSGTEKSSEDIERPTL